MVRNTTVDDNVISASFWSQFVIQSFLPWIFVSLSSIFGRSTASQQDAYDTEALRRVGAHTTFARVMHIFVYRQRPLVIELVRLCFEMCLLLFLQGSVGLLVVMSAWCLVDLMHGVHVLNLIYAKHTSSAREATTIVTYVYVLYSMLYGFPLAFIAKLMLIVWLSSRISLPTIFVPFYVEAVAALVFAFLFLLPTAFWRAGVHGCRKAIIRIQVIFLLVCFFILWLMVYFNVNVCEAAPLVYNPRFSSSRPDDMKNGGEPETFFSAIPCPDSIYSWTTCFIPFTVLLMVTGFSLLWVAQRKGLLVRLAPEIVSTWSGTLVMMVMVTSLDVANESSIHLFSISPRLAQFYIAFSILISVIANFILLKDVVYKLSHPSLHPPPDSSNSATESDVNNRKAVRQEALKDYIRRGSRTILTPTLKRYLQKRGRMRQCVVCFDDFKSSQNTHSDATPPDQERGEARASDDVLGIIRKCGHYFHFNCVWDWLQQRATCPLCRTPVEISRDAIKTMHYEDVRLAIGPSSGVGTLSSIVSSQGMRDADPGGSDQARSRTRAPIPGSLRNRPSANETEATVAESTSPAATPSEHSESQNSPSPHGTEEQAEMEELPMRPITASRQDADPTVTVTAAQQNTARTGEDRDGEVVSDSLSVVEEMTGAIQKQMRYSDKHCAICKAKYKSGRLGNDIAVGYLRTCGHYFHCECIERYVHDHERCPTCAALEKRLLRPSAQDSVHARDKRAGSQLARNSVEPQQTPSAREVVPSASNRATPSGGPRARRGSKRPSRDRKEGPKPKASGRSPTDVIIPQRVDNAMSSSSSTEANHGNGASPGSIYVTNGMVSHTAPASSGGNVVPRSEVSVPISQRGAYVQHRPTGLTTAAVAVLQRSVASEDILFAFLTDVQADLRRQRVARAGTSNQAA